VRGDLSVGGDTSVAGVIFSDDYTQITGELTVTSDLDIRGNIYDGATTNGAYVEIADHLSVSNDIIVEDSIRVGGDSATAGTGTIAVGGSAIKTYNVIGDYGATADNASVLSDDDLLIEGTVEIDEEIDIDGTGLNDIEGYMHLGDINTTTEGGTAAGSLAIDEDLTIVGGNIDTPVSALRLNAGKGASYPVFIGTQDHSGLAGGAGDLYVEHDLEVRGDLSIGGDTTIAGIVFSDDYTQVMDSMTVSEDIDVRGNIYDGAGAEVDVVDDLSITGGVTITNFLHVGSDGTGAMAIGGAALQGYNVIANNVSTKGNANVTDDDDLYIGGTVEIDGQLDIDGTGLNDFEGYLHIGDIDASTEGGTAAGSLAINEDLTIVGGNIDTTASALQLNAGKGVSYPVFVGATSHSGIAAATGDLYVAQDVEIGGDLSVGNNATMYGVNFVTNSMKILTDLNVLKNIYDSSAPEVDIADSLSIANDLTVDEGVLYVDSNNNRVGVNITTPSYALHVTGDALVTKDVTLSDSLSVAKQIYPTVMNGTTSTTYIIDYNDLGSTPTLQFEDATADETLLWNDASDKQTFELSDDLSLFGELTISNNILSFGNGERIDNLETNIIEFSSSYTSFTGDVTIDGDLTVLGTGAMWVPNSRLLVGDPALNEYGLEPGDGFFAGDVQVLNNVFAATISGSIAADGTTKPHFVIDQASAVDQHDVSLYFGDDDDDYAHHLKWKDNLNHFEISDDVTIDGALTVEQNILINGTGSSRIASGRLVIGSDTASDVSDDAGDVYVTGDVEIRGELSIGGDVSISGVIFGDDYTQIMSNLTLAQDLDIRGDVFDGAGTLIDIVDNLSVSGDLTLNGGDIRGLGITRIDMGEAETDMITMTGDVTISGDTTISGDLSVAGEIIGIDDKYVNIAGDTMTGTLYINTGGSALDIDGDIEYTGSLRNKSPVKFQDGVNIVNLGGISGGQLLGRDVIIALSDAILFLSYDSRTIRVPEIRFVRYTKMRPTITTKTESIVPSQGYLQLTLASNEHVISIKQINHHAFMRNVGLDGLLERAGDYKLATTNKVGYEIDMLESGSPIEITYSVRCDIDETQCIVHTLPAHEVVIPQGWIVLYLEEIPLSEISAHDTAAMSPETQVVVRCKLLQEYDYSADKYIVAIIDDSNNIVQYLKVKRS